MGKTWHPQLADKGSRVRNHMYYAIDKCKGSGTELRRLIDSCVPHFQNNHNQCEGESPCKDPEYVPEFTVLSDSVAVSLLTTFLRSLTLYKNAEDYALSKDTYYVESFNNAMLIYLDKRIHYSESSYRIRRDLAVLDWNTHVDRGYTSRSSKQNVCHNRQNLGKKAYKKKTYKYVSEIWRLLTDVVTTNDSENASDDEDIDENYYEMSDSE